MQTRAERETRQWSVCICGGAPMGRIFCYEIERYDDIEEAAARHEYLLSVVVDSPPPDLEDGWYPALMNTAHPYRPFVRKESR